MHGLEQLQKGSNTLLFFFFWWFLLLNVQWLRLVSWFFRYSWSMQMLTVPAKLAKGWMEENLVVTKLLLSSIQRTSSLREITRLNCNHYSCDIIFRLLQGVVCMSYRNYIPLLTKINSVLSFFLLLFCFGEHGIFYSGFKFSLWLKLV